MDYLEALLPEEEEEAEQALAPLPGVVWSGLDRGEQEDTEERKREEENPEEEAERGDVSAEEAGLRLHSGRMERMRERERVGDGETENGVPSVPSVPAAPALAEILAGEERRGRSWMAGGTAADSGAQVLLAGMGRARRAAMTLFRRENGAGNLAVPGEGPATSGLQLEELDRAVERDARRYDGGFSLY